MLSLLVYYLYLRKEEEIYSFLLRNTKGTASPCRQLHHITENIKELLKIKKKNTVTDGIENFSMNDVFRDFCALKILDNLLIVYRLYECLSN